MRRMAHMRFCMRKPCCSSLRQGSSRQATLISSVACVDDVFLSLILLISLSSLQQGLRQPILSITERRLLLRPSLPVGHWLEPTWRIDHHQESITGLLRSDLLLFAVLGGYCPPCAVRHGVRRWRSRLTAFHELHGRCANTIWSSLSVRVGLFIMTMGRSYLQFTPLSGSISP